MSSAFALTLAYLGEHEEPSARTPTAFAAYVTGNVASNLIGRLISAGVADHFGLAGEFPGLRATQSVRRAAGLVHRSGLPPHAVAATRAPAPVHRVAGAFARSAACWPGSAIGFCLLFAFIGTFTFVNFVLVRDTARSSA